MNKVIWFGITSGLAVRQQLVIVALDHTNGFCWKKRPGLWIRFVGYTFKTVPIRNMKLMLLKCFFNNWKILFLICKLLFTRRQGFRHIASLKDIQIRFQSSFRTNKALKLRNSHPAFSFQNYVLKGHSTKCGGMLESVGLLITFDLVKILF